MNDSVSPPAAAIEHWQAAFMAALSQIERVARFRFRYIVCHDTREDAICEVTALCWVWYVQLCSKGRRPDEFITALARFGATAVSCGRRACGQERVRDVLAHRCQQLQQFRVSPIPHSRIPDEGVFEDALCDNTQTPVPEQVQFRHDFAAWQRRLSPVNQRLVKGLALGHRTKDLAAKFRLSESRVSQLRKEFAEDYATFCGGSDCE